MHNITRGYLGSERARLARVHEQPHVRTDPVLLVDHAEADARKALIEGAQHLGEIAAMSAERSGLAMRTVQVEAARRRRNRSG